MDCTGELECYFGGGEDGLSQNEVGSLGEQRECRHGFFSYNKKTTTSSPKKKMVCKNGVCKPMKTSPVKVTNKSARLSASYYYHEMCGGKLKNCKPQIIQEPSGRRRLKEIKIVDGAHGKHPRWVLCE